MSNHKCVTWNNLYSEYLYTFNIILCGSFFFTGGSITLTNALIVVVMHGNANNVYELPLSLPHVPLPMAFSKDIHNGILTIMC